MSILVGHQTVSYKAHLVNQEGMPTRFYNLAGHEVSLLFKEWQAKIDKTKGGLDPFSKGYEKFGLIAQADRSILYCKWAPGAQNASLIGDFNNWDREANPMKKDQFGVLSAYVMPRHVSSSYTRCKSKSFYGKNSGIELVQVIQKNYVKFMDLNQKVANLY
ncbi:uncharacterized protein PGTG_12068 [Puccinia graminis f. sp. tritici CRL 75-36-700-3]|uniref:Glycoside hydrolase family 13 N-terminal domain-containing protein n=1 Tax=Puccinia graminis f. sp. tritici (strain CRL 75-36-700-3 / race SCCL) TaxID=418459 RepID=E3KP87_PUCGT|nr:uncharacterized protein PGTG_12068 [Puccinia graminis f. sp. tritici CRL 75-36-700-3]EFP86112.1 hypothetical protein PGTG_12068 [Puccinia graminis f. sp. tritici CRL 75-36-700-3]